MARIRQEVRDMEDDVAPEVRPSWVSNPNFAKSKVVHVRLSESVYLDLQEAAENVNRSVSDVLRAAVLQYLRGRADDGEVQDLVVALHDAGLRLVHE